MSIELDNLKESNEFLNLILENINSAILIADENMRIHQFNNSFLSLFDSAADRVVESSFGRIAGCVNAVKENKSCGDTSQCQFCVLRKTLLQTLVEDCPVDRKSMERIFYIKGSPVLKNLEVTSRLIEFHKQKMMLVIIYDVSLIEEQKRKLEIQQRQINHELETAGEIQKSLLPGSKLEINNIVIAWKFEPCGRIGGDIFQIHEISKEQIGIYMLDVCGHGVSAALVAVAITQFLVSLHNRMRLTGKTFTPEAVMKRLDKEFPMERFDCFFSIAYATLNIETGCFVYSNAGHMPPLILRSTGLLERLECHGTAIGSGFGAAFNQEEKQLKAGDRLILYTDGLIENFGMDGEREGKERLHAFMEKFHHLPTQDLIDRAFETAASQRGGSMPSDDMSLIAVEFTKR
jgi:sigma-B regulation protein RsbU (phosphoserine phosphatase)